MNELYEKIGSTAHAAKRTMTFADLGKQLGLDTTERGIANHIRGAYRYFTDKGDASTAATIARVFTGKDGSVAF